MLNFNIEVKLLIDKRNFDSSVVEKIVIFFYTN